MSMRTLFFLLSLFVNFAAPAGANALKTSAHTPHVEAELLSEHAAFLPGKEVWLGLRLEMKPHWHTYWKNPGDSGLGTQITWTLPKGVSASEIFWPLPEKIFVSPLTNFGFEGEVLLLTKLFVADDFSEDKISVQAKVDWLVCKEECIPEAVQLALELPKSTDGNLNRKPWWPQFEKVRGQQPKPLEGVTVTENEKEFILNIPALAGLAGNAKWEFFSYDANLVKSIGETRKKVASNFELRLPKIDAMDVNQEYLSGMIVVGGKSSFEVKVPVKAQVADALGQEPVMVPANIKESSRFHWMMLLFAFLGGVLLNLMPCVFPVLGIKVLSVVKKLGSSPTEIRWHGLFYLLGVMGSFWVLVSVLLALRSAGESVGWGFQLQSPGFVAFLVLLLFGVAMNFLGVFEIGGRIMGVGAGLQQKEGPSGAFFAGVLAVIVATPCTAPFMGTAIGVALSQSKFIAFLTFSFLGLGLAFPYVFLCFFPRLLSRLPRPGRWMETFKEFLAFPILATAVWLLWVFGAQKGFEGVSWLIGAVVALAFSFWLLRKGTYLFRALATLALLASLTMAFAKAVPMPSSSAERMEAEEGWQKFSQARLEQALKEKQAVFIDFTAAWCLTCQVNERTTLRRKDVREFFQQKKVLLLKADWTNQDEAITKALKGYGRAGVPVYVAYAAGSREAKILPQILSATAIFEAY